MRGIALGVVVSVVALFLLVSLFTLDPCDPPSPDYPANEQIANACGVAGAYFGGYLYDFLGVGAHTAAFLLLGLGIAIAAGRTPKDMQVRFTGACLFVLGVAMATGMQRIPLLRAEDGSHNPYAGIIGAFASRLEVAMGVAATRLLLFGIFIASLSCMFATWLRQAVTAMVGEDIDDDELPEGRPVSATQSASALTLKSGARHLPDFSTPPPPPLVRTSAKPASDDGVMGLDTPPSLSPRPVAATAVAALPKAMTATVAPKTTPATPKVAKESPRPAPRIEPARPALSPAAEVKAENKVAADTEKADAAMLRELLQEMEPESIAEPGQESRAAAVRPVSPVVAPPPAIKPAAMPELIEEPEPALKTAASVPPPIPEPEMETIEDPAENEEIEPSALLNEDSGTMDVFGDDERMEAPKIKLETPAISAGIQRTPADAAQDESQSAEIGISETELSEPDMPDVGLQESEIPESAIPESEIQVSEPQEENIRHGEDARADDDSGTDTCADELEPVDDIAPDGLIAESDENEVMGGIGDDDDFADDGDEAGSASPLPEDAGETENADIEAEARPDKPPRLPSEARKKPETGSGAPRPRTEYKLPSLDMIQIRGDAGMTGEDEQRIQATCDVLEKTLRDFNIGARVVAVQRGPVITLYEVALDSGVKLSKVVSLSDDLAMALKAPNARVVAPIPGKNTLGIEIPNARRCAISLREILESRPEEVQRMNIPLCLGMDVGGKGMAIDMAGAPHLLIAGATGSGKSVCINTIIMSILMTRGPDEVKLLMVDPKWVELSGYKDLPHLISPVITDMKRAAAVLEWACQKMDDRYAMLARAGVRNIAGYNRLNPKELKRRLDPSGEAILDDIELKLPYIVIIVDEFADLMMVAAKEVENSIIRLSQKSRAVGIHLILATQRPSVDVITGLIKANMPCRIAFQVTSKVDSRTILDMSGADKLLGKGDMLLLAPGTGFLERAQGCYVSDEEIQEVVEYWRVQGKPEYDQSLQQFNKSVETEPEDADELYEEAVKIVLEYQRGSVSLLQRKLGIGYSRSARIIDKMAEAGLLGEYKGSNARDVLVTLEEWEALRAQQAKGGKK
ncbi:MAG TPA: DNA translocase FtsK 4TM domain-containing protein [Candidatus Brocadiia bacterium]|nr:DNA translocase FtsK 4TM domain-containing protein [Candidatus Brocadiia bacterium]